MQVSGKLQKARKNTHLISEFIVGLYQQHTRPTWSRQTKFSRPSPLLHRTVPLCPSILPFKNLRIIVCVPGEFEEESKQPTLSEEQKHQLKHRELFLSRQFESLPATHIRYVLNCKRLPWLQPLEQFWGSLSDNFCLDATLHRGKCNVTLLNETDVLVNYLDKDVRHLSDNITLAWAAKS